MEDSDQIQKCLRSLLKDFSLMGFLIGPVLRRLKQFCHVFCHPLLTEYGLPPHTLIPLYLYACVYSIYTHPHTHISTHTYTQTPIFTYVHDASYSCSDCVLVLCCGFRPSIKYPRNPADGHDPPWAGLAQRTLYLNLLQEYFHFKIPCHWSDFLEEELMFTE